MKYLITLLMLVSMPVRADYEVNLTKFNTEINQGFAYVSDQKMYGKDQYIAKPAEFVKNKGGDCEDFALYKRHKLLELGVEKKNLQIKILRLNGCMAESGACRHAVLIMNGVWVFDNRFNVVYRFQHGIYNSNYWDATTLIVGEDYD